MQANHYIESHPQSHFRKNLVVARQTPTGRVTILNDEFRCVCCYQQGWVNGTARYRICDLSWAREGRPPHQLCLPRAGAPSSPRRVWREGGSAPEEERQIDGEDELLGLLRDHFGIVL